MPAQSRAQFRWLHTPSAQRALGKAGVKEWISKTNVHHLPDRKEPRKFGQSPVSRST